MAQSMINFRMDTAEKKSFEEVCEQLGLSITTAFKMFAKKVIREKRIPFDVAVDPFYSEKNMEHLKKIIDENPALIDGDITARYKDYGNLIHIHRLTNGDNDVVIFKNFADIFYDGNYTSIYTTQDRTAEDAEKKITDYHQALGGTVIKVTTTQRG